MVNLALRYALKSLVVYGAAKLADKYLTSDQSTSKQKPSSTQQKQVKSQQKQVYTQSKSIQPSSSKTISNEKYNKILLSYAERYQYRKEPLSDSIWREMQSRTQRDISTLKEDYNKVSKRLAKR